MINRTRRHWWRILGTNAVAAILAATVFSNIGLHTPARRIVATFAVAFLFSMCIGPLVGLVMGRIAPLIWARLRFPLNWLASAATMIVLAAVGSIAAIAILVTIGYVPLERFGEWFAGSLRIAIAVTLTIGLFVTAYEVNKARVAAASAEAQLAALESKVQPHFLFNTLNSIAELIRHDPSAAERMTTQLASLLRSSLAKEPTRIVSLDDELRLVRDYLEIERVRFGDRLRYEIDVDAAAATAGVPRLALQTLVENSIKYAVSPRNEGGRVIIRASASDDRVRVEVRDDGPGFDVRNTTGGHGLTLLRERLAIMFGPKAALQIDSTPAGSTVTMTLPAVRGEDLVLEQKVPSGWATAGRCGPTSRGRSDP
jgi:two-component system sensor histidine kinase AlgZ